MGMTLEEYAALHPMPEPPQEAAATTGGRSYADALAEREKVAQLKDSITHQLEAGNAPQTILYTAIRAIGLLTHDAPWSEAAERALDSVYSDLAQQSLLTDTAAAATARLDEMREQYAGKMQRQIKAQLNACKRLTAALQEAQAAANALQPSDDQAETE